MKQKKEKHGYLRVRLGLKKKNKLFLVHRVIASAFLGLDIMDITKKVCHKDDNPLNNNVNNLFIGTQLDNVRDMINKGREGYRFTSENNPRQRKTID